MGVGDREHALVVSADLEAAAAIRAALGQSYRVTTTADPVEAARLLEVEPIDLVFADEPAPSGAGLELLVRAVSLRRDALRVLLVTQPELGLALRAVNAAHVSGILQKPLGPAALAPLEGCLELAARRKAEHAAFTATQSELVEAKRSLTQEVEDKTSAIARLGRQLDSLSIRDDRTGLFNERYLHDRAEEEVKRARRRSAPLSLVLCDLDTPAGAADARSVRRAAEDILADMAKLIASTSRDGPGLRLRDSDVVARYGERAIGLLLPDTPRVGAAVVASRLRDVVARARFKGSDARPFSLRLGYACFPDEAKSRGELIERADQALYQAHGAGLAQPLAFED